MSKSHRAIEAVGSIDELNSILGVVCSESISDDLRSELAQVQNDLFDLGSRVSACLSETDRVADFTDMRIVYLENLIDRYDGQLPTLEAFILPSGCPAACQLHFARSVCRRSERRLVELSEHGDGLKRRFPTEQIYLNRLSDLLFVLSRAVNLAAGAPERQWQVTKKG